MVDKKDNANTEAHPSLNVTAIRVLKLISWP